MTATRTWVRHELVLVLLGLALLLPRLSGLGSNALQDCPPDESTQAAVGYAKLRLWSEFVRGREELLTAVPVPPPTLGEYRQYLSGLGLRRRGDASTLVVLPLAGLDASRIGSEIDVRLTQAHPPLLLSLYVPGEEGRPKPVGQIEIRVNEDNVVSCLTEAHENAKWFSAWPVRPLALLP